MNNWSMCNNSPEFREALHKTLEEFEAMSYEELVKLAEKNQEEFGVYFKDERREKK